MKIIFCSVGKPHEDYIKSGVDDFSNRVSKYFSVHWHIIPPAKVGASATEGEIKKLEAKSILQFLQPEDYLILLDETGKQFSSIELSSFIQQRANDSNKKLVFLIGGAFGVDAGIKQRADFCWSLSRLVFPHMLVRLILAEQVYRACSILRNEKYHHK
ncbi:MAG TPA: 23S rRNA (pseudouridine(1915)-N(3))-methyltransferase RlmH [Panacibacter sp.]|nr:23S rRNA (pseudouridine(1915)-N(3))-methyltransferase RlmH [Panacibacter sp.]HNP45168.1 23S rRNA (pseudouridine(1915)-N(3))-methyltransferase RlmH [Panacibacter sp.]